MSKINAKVFMGVGGSFDVIGGKINRAPQWMIKCNMEWLYRVSKEPWRIKRLNSIPKFMYRAIREHRKNKDKKATFNKH
jgi:N-acetylmannosaminyltransferase (EC 2.4.1.187)